MKADKQEHFLVTGCLNGSAIIWENKESDLHRKWSCWDFESPVTDIFIQEESKVLVLASQQGKMVIYNMYTRELFRILYHPDNMPVHKIVLSLQPFGSIVFYSEEDGKVYSYSVNGQQLASKRFKESRMTDLQLSSDSNNMDFIVRTFVTLGLWNLDRRDRYCECALLRQLEGLHGQQEDPHHILGCDEEG